MSDIVSDKTYVFHFNLKKYDWNKKISLFKKDMWDMKKTLRQKIICLDEVYIFSAGHFLIRYKFCVLTSNIENQEFNFLTKIREIQSKN